MLFTGLEADMIPFLKDYIRDLYRNLRGLYENDKDETVRLHAQLALEEVNENVGMFLLMPPQLQQDKMSLKYCDQ